MQMHIPHSLVVLVVSLGLFASATPQYGIPQACPFEQVVVPVDVVNTCPQPEITSIRTIYRTVTELVPNSGCTDDFTDFANVQRIADTACRNGLVFTAGLKTRKRGIFERSPSCQSYSIVKRAQGGSLKRRDGLGGLSDIIHDKFEAYSDNFRHNIDQNINNNGNIDEEDTKETSAGGGGRGGFGGFGGFKKSKRSPQWGFGGFGGRGGRGSDGGAFDDNNNQNINQNVNANQNLMANLGRFNSFFGEGRGNRGGCDGGSGFASSGLNGLGFGINENTDFNVNNNVAFEDTGFFKNKRSLEKRNFGFGEDEAFSNNNNQNINQNINNNQNLNEGFFRGVFGGGNEGGEGGDFGGFGVVPFFPGFIGGFDGGFGGGFGGADAMNENVNVNDDENGRNNRFGFGNGFGGGDFGGGDFGGGFKVKRSPCGAAGYGGYSACDEISSGSSNININTNNNANQLPAPVYEQAVPYIETVVESVPYVESVPVVETVYQPTIAYEPYQYIETVPVVQEVFEPVQVIEQVARPVGYYESAQIARPDFYGSRPDFYESAQIARPDFYGSARPDFYESAQIARPDFYESAQVIEQVARPASFNAFEPVIPQIKAKVIEEKFNLAPVYDQISPVYEQYAQALPVIEQPVATVVETVVQPQVEVIQPVEVVAPVAVQVQPVIEYEAVFFEAPSCGVPNYPSYSIPQSCSGNGYGGYGGLGGFGGLGGLGGLGGYGNY